MDENRPSENRYPVFALLLGSLAFTGCAKRESPGIRGEQGGDDRLFVVTTIFPYYDLCDRSEETGCG